MKLSWKQKKENTKDYMARTEEKELEVTNSTQEQVKVQIQEGTRKESIRGILMLHLGVKGTKGCNTVKTV